MPRSSFVLLSCLVLATPACRPSPNPPDPQPPEPVVQQDPIEEEAHAGRGKIGEDEPDTARLVEPGPADAAVRTGKVPEQPER